MGATTNSRNVPRPEGISKMKSRMRKTGEGREGMLRARKRDEGRNTQAETQRRRGAATQRTRSVPSKPRAKGRDWDPGTEEEEEEEDDAQSDVSTRLG